MPYKMMVYGDSILGVMTAKNNTIIETTEKRVAYFGSVMTPEEADDFCYDCL